MIWHLLLKDWLLWATLMRYRSPLWDLFLWNYYTHVPEISLPASICLDLPLDWWNDCWVVTLVWCCRCTMVHALQTTGARVQQGCRDSGVRRLRHQAGQGGRHWGRRACRRVWRARLPYPQVLQERGTPGLLWRTLGTRHRLVAEEKDWTRCQRTELCRGRQGVLWSQQCCHHRLL